MEVEYTLCQIQSGRISLAAKTHRQDGGDPRLAIQVTSQSVRWELSNLVEGEPETVMGPPRQDHIDFYFLYESFLQDRVLLPQPTGQPDLGLRLPTANPTGMERRGGTRLRPVFPAYRFRVESVELFVVQTPSFRARGNEPFLHLDFETTPPGRYGQESLEIHFGIQADFEILDSFTGLQSRAVIDMTPETYATIFSEIQQF